MHSSTISHVATVNHLTVGINNPYTPLRKPRNRPALTIPGPPHLLTKAGLENKHRSFKTIALATSPLITTKITRIARGPGLVALQTIWADMSADEVQLWLLKNELHWTWGGQFGWNLQRQKAYPGGSIAALGTSTHTSKPRHQVRTATESQGLFLDPSKSTSQTTVAANKPLPTKLPRIPLCSHRSPKPATPTLHLEMTSSLALPHGPGF